MQTSSHGGACCAEKPAPKNASLKKAVPPGKPTRAEAEQAVRTILAWIGDDPEREGLRDTPGRVVSSFDEFYSGYTVDPEAFLAKTFEQVSGYNDIVLMKNMRFESHCEHHMAPIIGVGHIAYLPDNRIVGISKLARVLDVYAKRLQTQEIMTAQIAHAIETALAPKGVAVVIDAEHQCMTTRGVYKHGASTVTCDLRGAFATDPVYRERLYKLLER
jgi:GTP cyclohydrolase I